MRVLIADDDLTSRDVLAAALVGLGYDVVPTCDGDEALGVMTGDDAPRLAVLDWLMPGLEGPALCRAIRAVGDERQPHLILLTALDDKAHVVEGLDAGADDYIVKPFDPVELRARIAVGARIVGLRDRLAAKAEELRLALAEVRTLRGLVPICMHCKRVRKDEGLWQNIADYVAARTEAEFTHGLCPECMEEHYSDLIER